MSRALYIFPPFYVAVTILFYMLGPWDFVGAYGVFGLYLVVCLSFVALGVALGWLIRTVPTKPVDGYAEMSVFKVALFFSVVFAIPTTYARTGAFIPDFIFGIRNPSEAYIRAIDSVYPGFEYLRIAFAPLLFCTFPLGVLVWSRMEWYLRLIFAIFCVHTILLFVAMGVNRGIFDMIFGGGYVLLIERARVGDGLRFRWFRVLFVGSILLFFAFAFFVYGQINREGSGASSGYFFAANIYSALQPNSAVTAWEGYLYIFINQLSIYLAQGYYGASLVFERGIDGLMFGVGHSDFLLRNFGKILGGEFVAASPVYLIEGAEGWQHGNFWFSIIPWIASDVGFLGVPLVIFSLSYIYARSVKAYLDCGDWVCLMVAYSLFYMFLYFSANNYIVQSGEGFVASYVFLFLWIIRRGVLRGAGFRAFLWRTEAPCSWR